MSILKKTQVSLNANLPFVAYKKPNQKIVSAFFQQNDTLHIAENYKESGFVFAPFDDKKLSVLIPMSSSECMREEFSLKEETIDVIYSADESSKTTHKSIVKKGIAAIHENRFKKVVLSRKEKIDKKEIDIVNTFERLLNTYKNAFVYVWFHPKIGLWMGATPEILIKIKKNSFETMSLAGTQVFNADQKVEWRAKEIEEQQLVTDYVLQKLKLVCTTVTASKVETIKAGNLLHLKTVIKGEFDKNPSELIHVLHPTPAVCGYPKNESKEFILKNEGYDRSYYTGFLGELNMPNSELFVNLRCMEIENKALFIYVGGGITKESDPEKEWQETVAKAKTMKKVL